ncbi:MAG: hypothetical protein HDQ88_12090 [Clostridia bacterium]|nr:hypothetical protein [Clostridia bacterium]
MFRWMNGIPKEPGIYLYESPYGEIKIFKVVEDNRFGYGLVANGGIPIAHMSGRWAGPIVEEPIEYVKCEVVDD